MINEPRMSDALIQKIIASQTKAVFEDAPDGVRILLENMPVTELITPKKGENAILPPNEKWKTRLQEYLLELRARGSDMVDPSVTEPKGNETVLQYAKRIMPIVTKAEAIKES